MLGNEQSLSSRSFRNSPWQPHVSTHLQAERLLDGRIAERGAYSSQHRQARRWGNPLLRGRSGWVGARKAEHRRGYYGGGHSYRHNSYRNTTYRQLT